MDSWLTNSATVWILTELFLLLGPQVLPTGCLPPRTKNTICIALMGSGRKGHPFYSALLTWKWMFFWCFFVLYFHPKLSAAVTHGKKGKGSKVCEISNQGAMHADETAIQSVLTLKGRTEVLPNYGTSSSKILLNYLNSQLHHRFIF